ncbi:histidine utilization repressor [Allorhizobium taibaishanense]|uniref:Histidine utilization repressor n=1 Tax=Allorhizobium taibaishanense TaxID=887144 RepID=A0A1Q9ABN9_9HYPH|nr:histidine utilization repressor [Allorhizobium taibaishanense]MBB4010610.1 GntR family histidine utilization transcriptional repressor [Allorhizobium taibaishanense]OLP52288.1 histidine utilization repressor [Allorhizobium taibaishanense]
MTSATQASKSLHQRILEDIEDNILSGRWPPGHKIPSEQVLAEDYGCSRMTVNKVVTQLARAGLVLRRRKTGSIVMPQNSQSAILEIYDIRDEVEALDLAYRHDILARTARAASKTELSALGLPPRRKLLAVTCLHYAGDRPFCLEERLINLSIVPEAAEADFADLAPGPWLLDHVPWNAAEHRIAAEAASPTAANLLHIAPEVPVLVVERQTWRLDETVTQVRLTYPGGQHALTARFTPSQRPNAA